MTWLLRVCAGGRGSWGSGVKPQEDKDLGSPTSQLLNKLVLLHYRIPVDGDSKIMKWV